MTDKSLQVRSETHYKLKLQSIKESKTIKDLIDEMIDERAKKWTTKLK